VRETARSESAVLPDTSFAFLLADDETFAKPAASRKWALALVAGQAGNFSGENNDLSQMYAASKAPSIIDGTVVSSPPGTIIETNNSIPLSFGLTFRYYFTSRWALESGLVYTYLSSEYIYNNNTSIEQQLHYLGLPLNVVYQFFGSRRFSLYLSGGGMAEKGLSANYAVISSSGKTKTRDNIDGIQWSLNGQLGVSYNLSTRFSLYAEPGVRYFLSDEKQPESIRTDKPFNFSLGFGVRTNF
jgi:opacity protein-like surface antigen